MGDMWASAYWIINRAKHRARSRASITMDPTLAPPPFNEARFLRGKRLLHLCAPFGDVPLLEPRVKSLDGLRVVTRAAARRDALIVSGLCSRPGRACPVYTGSDIGR